MVRVLIVDDEPTILKMVSSSLTNAGFDTYTCHMWPGVANLVRSVRPDLVLLDYNMPGVNGGDICQILRRNPLGADMKIVLYSAEDEGDLARIVNECGADGYIKKSTRGAQLVSVLGKLLKAGGAPRRASSRNSTLTEGDAAVSLA